MNGFTRFPKLRQRAGLAAGLLVATQFACVERTVKINTIPEGATVFLNDQEVGKSPVKVPFTWYGDYDIIIRKEGHQTVKTNHRIDAPWYQWPFIDLFTECLIPFTLHDDRELEPYVLEPAIVPNKEELVQRADEMKAQSHVEAPSDF